MKKVLIIFMMIAFASCKGLPKETQNTQDFFKKKYRYLGKMTYSRLHLPESNRVMYRTWGLYNPIDPNPLQVDEGIIPIQVH